MMIKLAIAFIVYAALEAAREYLFYQFNRALNFNMRAEDSQRKAVNVGLFLLFSGGLAFGFGDNNLMHPTIIMSEAIMWRWLVLDGLLNHFRQLPFFYPGSTGRSFTDVIQQKMPLWLRALVKIGAPIALTILSLYI